MSEINAGELVVGITANLNKFRDGIQDAGKQIQEFGKTISKTAGESRDKLNSFMTAYEGDIKTISLALGVMGVAITATLGLMIKSAADQETVFRHLQTRIELTGNSWSKSKGQIDAFIKSMVATTVYSDTETAAVLQKIMIYTNDLGKAFQGTKLAIDMAASGMFSAEAAARYIGMAMSGNVMMLARWIPELRESTNEQLKNMSASEKAAYAMEILTKKFSGAAQKDLETFNGRMKQLSNYLSDISETIGDVFLPGLTEIAKKGGEFSKGLEGFIKERPKITTFFSTLIAQLGIFFVSLSGIALALVHLWKPILSLIEAFGALLAKIGISATVGTVLGSLGLLAIAISFLAMNWKDLGNIFDWTWNDKIKPAIDGMIQGFKDLKGAPVESTYPVGMEIVKPFGKIMTREELGIEKGWEKPKHKETEEEKKYRENLWQQTYERQVRLWEYEASEKKKATLKEITELHYASTMLDIKLGSQELGLKLNRRKKELDNEIYLTNEQLKKLYDPETSSFAKLGRYVKKTFADTGNEIRWQLERVAYEFDRDIIGGNWKKAFRDLKFYAQEAGRDIGAALLLDIEVELSKRLGKAILKIFTASVVWEGIKGLGKEFVEHIGNIWSWLKGIPGASWNAIISSYEFIKEQFGRIIGIINNIKGITGIWGWLKGIPGTIWDAIISSYKFIKENFGAIKTVIDNVKNITGVWSWLKGVPGTVLDALETSYNFIKGAFGRIKGVIEDIKSITGIWSWLKGHSGSVENAIEKTYNWIKDVFGRVKSIIDTIKDIKDIWEFLKKGTDAFTTAENLIKSLTTKLDLMTVAAAGAMIGWINLFATIGSKEREQPKTPNELAIEYFQNASARDRVYITETELHTLLANAVTFPSKQWESIWAEFLIDLRKRGKLEEKKYHFGGIVSGIVGQERTIKVLAGEEVIPRSSPRHSENLGISGGNPINIYISGNTIADDQSVKRLANTITKAIGNEMRYRQRYSTS